MPQASALSLPSPASATSPAGPPASGSRTERDPRHSAVARLSPDSTSIELLAVPPRYDDAFAWSTRDREVDGAFHDQLERVMQFRHLRREPYRPQYEPEPVQVKYPKFAGPACSGVFVFGV